MKKIYSFISALIICASFSSCGNLGNMGGMGTGTPTPDATSSVLNSDAIGNIISVFASGILTNQQTLVGSWTYTKPCVQFESENLLAKAGGAVAASNVENKLASIYQMAGIKPGAMKFVFGKDNTVQYNIGGRTATGQYVFDATRKTVTITTQSGMNVTAYVSVSLNSLGLTFEASKLLALVNTASALSSQLSTIGAIAGSFSGMKVGFQFSK